MLIATIPHQIAIRQVARTEDWLLFDGPLHGETVPVDRDVLRIDIADKGKPLGHYGKALNPDLVYLVWYPAK